LLVSGLIASDTDKIAESAMSRKNYFAESAIIFLASKIGHEQGVSPNPDPPLGSPCALGSLWRLRCFRSSCLGGWTL